MIGIVLPTRGLVFTQVEDALERERSGFDVKIYRSHDLRIPYSHTKLTLQALQEGSDYIFFVEEDTVPPEGSLKRMLDANADVVCIDYGVAGWGCVARDTAGEILWCGLGCTLVKKEVFAGLTHPYFRTDKTLSLNDGTWKDLPPQYVENKVYGGHDIWFFTQVREHGFKIVQLEGECDHLLLEDLGKREVNGGLHKLAMKPKISKKQVINLPIKGTTQV